MKLLRRIAFVIANTKLPLEAKGVSARFARFLTDKNNPDHIIVAHILQSFATEFDQWLVKSGSYLHGMDSPFLSLPKVTTTTKQDYEKDRYYSFDKSGFSVYIHAAFRHENYGGGGKISSLTFKTFTVNKIPISLDLAEGLVRSYEELRDKYVAAEKAAKEARAAMEANEKKWDIVENVLGMKRDATGLLQPKAVPCKCNRVADCYDGEGCREDA